MADVLCLDLETTVDPAMPPHVSRNGRDEFPPAPFWIVRVAGCVSLDAGTYQTRKIGCIPGETEEEIVRCLVDHVQRKRPTIATFNGRGFDLPVIVAACVRHGIPAPRLFSREVSYRYSSDGALDVADALSNFGAGRYAGQDAWARLTGMPGKIGTTGADVAELLAAGEIARVRAYCLEDVAQLAALVLRTRLVDGGLSAAEYRTAAESLLDAITGTPELAALAAGIDRGRFLLAA